MTLSLPSLHNSIDIVVVALAVLFCCLRACDLLENFNGTLIVLCNRLRHLSSIRGGVSFIL
jgi:hypothetical protein